MFVSHVGGLGAMRPCRAMRIPLCLWQMANKLFCKKLQLNTKQIRITNQQHSFLHFEVMNVFFHIIDLTILQNKSV